MSVIKNNTAPQITHTSWLAHLLSHWSTGQEEQSALRKGAIPSKVHPEHLQFVLLHEFEEQVQSVIDLLRSGVTINRPWTCGNDVVSLIDMVQGLDTIKPKTSELLYSIWDVGFSAVLGRHECAMQGIMFRWSGGSKYLWCEAMLCAQLEWGDIAGNILHWALLRRHYKQITIVLDMVSFLKTQTPAFHKKYVNIPMSNGDTAIHLACRERLLDPTKRLCKHRCVELLKNAKGFTAAHECALNNFVEGLETLEAYTTKDSTWYDAIHDALRVGVQHGHIEIVKKCIEFGGDVCQEGLLALAVSQGHLELCMACASQAVTRIFVIVTIRLQ